MSSLVPHLLLRANAGSSNAAGVLRAAGYMVSRIDKDNIVEQIAGAPHVDGVVVELAALGAIRVVRGIEARHGGKVVVVVITPAADTVRRALPSTAVLRPDEVDDDLVSTMDLALVAYHTRRTG